MRKLIIAVFGVLIAAAPAAAQQEKPVDVNFGFGWAIPAGDFKNSFDSGWSGTFAATFNVSPTFGVQGEYMYDRMDGPSRTITVYPTNIQTLGSAQLLESNHQVHAFTGNVVLKSHNRAALGGYVLGGAGLYHRIVQITSPAVGYATFCDPYWYVCYPSAVSVDNIIGDRSSNDFGINVGGGVTFGREVKFYVEARYHYVWGPEIANSSQLPAATATTTGGSTNAQYFPITFGIRF